MVGTADAGSGFELGVHGDNDIVALRSDGAGSGVFGFVGKDGRGSIAFSQPSLENLNHYVMRIDYDSSGDDILTLYVNPTSNVEGCRTAAGSVIADWTFDRIGALNFQNAPGFLLDMVGC